MWAKPRAAAVAAEQTAEMPYWQSHAPRRVQPGQQQDMPYGLSHALCRVWLSKRQHTPHRAKPRAAAGVVEQTTAYATSY